MKRLAAVFVNCFLFFSFSAFGSDNKSDVAKSGVIRFCLDPDNMPFSSSVAGGQGYDFELSRAIASDIGLTAEYNWYSSTYGKRAIRQLIEGSCDAFVGVPSVMQKSLPKVLLTNPYYQTGFYSVGLNAESVFGKETPVGIEMMTVADFQAFRSGFDRKIYSDSKEIVDDLISGKLRVAYVWYPRAVWYAKNRDVDLKVVKVEGLRQIKYDISIAVRDSDPELVREINEALANLKRKNIIDKILSGYLN